MSRPSAASRRWERDNIQLTVNAGGARCRWCWRSGRKREKITVTAEAPLIEAEKSDRGMLIDNKKVVDLPINTRNPIMLAALSNGIVHTSGTTLDQKPFSNSADGSWSINGGIGSTVEFLLDGAPNNTIYNGVSTVANVPSVDAVQEFKVMTSTYDAQYGHTGGGAINISLKSGTNGFHGSGYEYLKRAQVQRGDVLGQRSRQSDACQRSRPVRLHRSAGRCACRSSTTAKTRRSSSSRMSSITKTRSIPREKVASVPTPAQRKGDFSDTRDNAGRLITIYDPLTGKADASGKWVRTAFPGNIIPADRINPVSQKILALYPLPNTLSAGSPAWQNNYFWGDNIANFNFKNVMARVDHNFNAKERMYARWSWSNFDQVRTANAIPGLGGDHRDGGKYSNGGVVDSVTTINSSTHLQYARGALLLDGADRSAGFRLRRDAVGLAGVGGEPTDQADPAAQRFPSRARPRWATRPANITFEPTTTAQPAAEHGDDPRQADDQGRARLPA